MVRPALNIFIMTILQIIRAKYLPPSLVQNGQKAFQPRPPQKWGKGKGAKLVGILICWQQRGSVKRGSPPTDCECLPSCIRKTCTVYQHHEDSDPLPTTSQHPQCIKTPLEKHETLVLPLKATHQQPSTSVTKSNTVWSLQEQLSVSCKQWSSKMGTFTAKCKPWCTRLSSSHSSVPLCIWEFWDVDLISSPLNKHFENSTNAVFRRFSTSAGKVEEPTSTY